MEKIIDYGVKCKAIGLIFYVSCPNGILNHPASKGEKTHTWKKHNPKNAFFDDNKWIFNHREIRRGPKRPFYTKNDHFIRFKNPQFLSNDIHFFAYCNNFADIFLKSSCKEILTLQSMRVCFLRICLHRASKLTGNIENKSNGLIIIHMCVIYLTIDCAYWLYCDCKRAEC